MDVLIAFVTTNDPWPPNKNKEGPAQTVTAAKALNPQFVHLIYTDSTSGNFQDTEAFLKKGLNPMPLQIQGHKLDLDDPTDYHRLMKLMPPLLKGIRKQHPGGRFYLVSGLAQPRIIFALCLTSQVLDGALLEVQRPDPTDPWPATPEGYQQRLEELDLSFFEHFREIFREQYEAIRLRLDLNTQQAWLDKHKMDLRAVTRGRPAPEGFRPRPFQTLVLLAAKKRYGAGDDIVPKALIRRTAYSDQSDVKAAVNIRRALDSLNRQARRLTEDSPQPFDPLIQDVKRGGKPIGSYRLTDKLSPADETIKFVGDLRVYLQSMGVARSDLQSLFPDLPR